MSLPDRQQRALEVIQERLRISDPRLTSLFVIFTRLTRDEDMPRIEELRARLDVLRARAGSVAGPLIALGRNRAAQRVRRLRAVLLVPAALIAMTCAVLVAAAFPGGQRTPPNPRTHTARVFVPAARLCPFAIRTC